MIFLSFSDFELRICDVIVDFRSLDNVLVLLEVYRFEISLYFVYFIREPFCRLFTHKNHPRN